MENIVEINKLTKRFGNVTAVDGLEFGIQAGRIFGVIGPDGAGKTTLFRLISSLYTPDEGSVSVLGFDTVKEYKKIRRLLGYMPGEFSLYYDLSVEENLKFFATIFDTTISENYHLVKDIYSQIEPFKDRPAGKLSGGMKQKLALSCALIHKPELLILDEPTTGVDAVSRVEFWEMLKHLRDDGLSILVSTPYMDEALKCDEIALMQNGRFLKMDEPEKIISSFERTLFGIYSSEPQRCLNYLGEMDPGGEYYRFGQEIHYMPSGDETGVEDLEEKLRVVMGEAKVRQVQPGIEDCFMAYLKTEAHD